MPAVLPTFTERQRYAEGLRTEFAKRLQAMTQDHLDGKMSLQDWNLTMRSELKRMYALMLVTGAGGDKASVSSDDWLKLGNALQKQYRFLERFANELRAGKTGGAVARAGMYGKSSYQAFWNQAMPVKLPAQPGDGSTQCRTNCACSWEIKYEYNTDGKVTHVLAYWRLGAAEHCPDCVARSRKWNPLKVKVPGSFNPGVLFKVLRAVRRGKFPSHYP